MYTGFPASKFFMAVNLSREARGKFDIPSLVIKTAMKTDKPILKISFARKTDSNIPFSLCDSVFFKFENGPTLVFPRYGGDAARVV